MPLKTTAIDMNALLDAWEAEREALRARPRSTTHVVDFSCGVEQPAHGGVGARSSVRRSRRTGWIAARGTVSVSLAADPAPELPPRVGRGDAALSLGEWYGRCALSATVTLLPRRRRPPCLSLLMAFPFRAIGIVLAGTATSLCLGSGLAWSPLGRAWRSWTEPRPSSPGLFAWSLC